MRNGELFPRPKPVEIVRAKLDGLAERQRLREMIRRERNQRAGAPERLAARRAEREEERRRRAEVRQERFSVME